MNYTCKDCKVQCMERSREYTCSSFTLGNARECTRTAVKGKTSKSNRVKSKGGKTTAQNV